MHWSWSTWSRREEKNWYNRGLSPEIFCTDARGKWNHLQLLVQLLRRHKKNDTTVHPNLIRTAVFDKRLHPVPTSPTLTGTTHSTGGYGPQTALPPKCVCTQNESKNVFSGNGGSILWISGSWRHSLYSSRELGFETLAWHPLKWPWRTLSFMTILTAMHGF